MEMHFGRLTYAATLASCLFLASACSEEQAQHRENETPAVEDAHAGHDHAAGMHEAGKKSTATGSPEVKKQIGQIFDAYLPLQSALAADNQEKAAEALKAVEQELKKAAQVETDDPTEAYVNHLHAMQEGLAAMKQAETIDVMREGFHKLSNELIASLKQLGYESAHTAHITHCPMAFDNQGADWLQADTKVMNPYFGDQMLHCGSVEGTI